MVGLSYPGIAQLFVASHPAAAPRRHHAAVGLRRHRPGRARSRRHLQQGVRARPGPRRCSTTPKPYGQGWSEDRRDAGDEICAANQKMRLQNVDAVAKARKYDYYEPVSRRPAQPGAVRRRHRGARLPRRAPSRTSRPAGDSRSCSTSSPTPRCSTSASTTAPTPTASPRQPGRVEGVPRPLRRRPPGGDPAGRQDLHAADHEADLRRRPDTAGAALPGRALGCGRPGQVRGGATDPPGLRERRR